jgi:hypothetical protein
MLASEETALAMTEESANGKRVVRVVNNSRSVSVINLLSVVADATSPAAASSSAVTTPVTGLAVFSSITIVVTITGATGGTLDVVIETSGNGTDWYEYVRFPTAAATAAAKSYTHDPQLTGAIVNVGKNLTTTMVLAANSARGGHWGDRMRVRYVTGASNTAGAVQAIEIHGVKDSA